MRMRSATGDRTASWRDEVSGLDAAQRLSDALRNGGRLEPVAIEGVPIAPGELAFADLSACGWRYYALGEVFYQRRMFLFGGPLLMALTGMASALGNSRRRQAAERAAAPQWRPLGSLRIIVTSERLLVWFDQAWWSVWYSAITDIRSDPANSSLDLLFETDPPYRLVGPHIPALAVVLAQAARGENFGVVQRLRNANVHE